MNRRSDQPSPGPIRAKSRSRSLSAASWGISNRHKSDAQAVNAIFVKSSTDHVFLALALLSCQLFFQRVHLFVEVCSASTLGEGFEVTRQTFSAKVWLRYNFVFARPVWARLMWVYVRAVLGSHPSRPLMFNGRSLDLRPRWYL